MLSMYTLILGTKIGYLPIVKLRCQLRSKDRHEPLKVNSVIEHKSACEIPIRFSVNPINNLYYNRSVVHDKLLVKFQRTQS